MIKISHLSKQYGNLKVLNDFSLNMIPGAVHVFIGPSGCGKTTLLNIIAGLIPPDEGSVEWDEAVLKQPYPVSFCFQEDRLLPWRTVRQNLEFVLQDSKKHGKKIEEMLQMFKIEKFKDFPVRRLSGGQRQRIAMVRALMFSAALILLDEPFKSLDRKLKIELLNDTRRILKKINQYMIFVTHDIEEAFLLGDFVYKLSDRPAEITDTIDISGVNKDGYHNNKVFIDLVTRIYQ